MLRCFAIPTALLLLAACDPQPPRPAVSTLAPEGSLGNVPVASKRSADGAYAVRVSENRKVALVRAATRTPTIAGIEAAATATAKCPAKVVQVTYDAMGNDRNAVIPASEFAKYGGLIPTTLTCS